MLAPPWLLQLFHTARKNFCTQFQTPEPTSPRLNVKEQQGQHSNCGRDLHIPWYCLHNGLILMLLQPATRKWIHIIIPDVYVLVLVSVRWTRIGPTELSQNTQHHPQWIHSQQCLQRFRSRRLLPLQEHIPRHPTKQNKKERKTPLQKKDS